MYIEALVFAIAWLGIIFYLTYDWRTKDRPEKALVAVDEPVFDGRPLLWVFVYPTTNSRQWSDFMSRKSKAVNYPWINLCVSSIVNNNPEFNIHIITPSRLSEYIPEIPINLEDIEYDEPLRDMIKWSILTKYGGVWVSPRTICTESFIDMMKLTEVYDMVFIGCDTDTALCLDDSTRVGTEIVAAAARSPIAARIATEVSKYHTNKLATGYEYRQTEKYIISQEIKKNGSKILVGTGGQDGTRMVTGRRVEIDHLLSQNEVPFADNMRNVIIPEELVTRDNWGWFCRMSEKQILASDMCISRLFRTALPHDIVRMILDDRADVLDMTAIKDIESTNYFNTQPQVLTYAKA